MIDYKSYSPAMKASRVVWSEETIDAFIYDPDKIVPGIPMAAVVFIEKAKDRQDIVSYLRRQDIVSYLRRQDIVSYLRRQDKRNDSCP